MVEMMDLNRRLSIALVLMGMFFVSASNAEIYKWVDENGQVHFGDKPHGKQTEKVELKSSVSEAQKRDAEKINQNYQRIYQQFKQQDQARAEQQKKVEQKRKQLAEYCEKLRKEKNLVNQDYAIVRYNDEGGREFLTDEEIDSYRNEINSLYQERCGEQ